MGGAGHRQGWAPRGDEGEAQRRGRGGLEGEPGSWGGVPGMEGGAAGRREEPAGVLGVAGRYEGEARDKGRKAEGGEVGGQEAPRRLEEGDTE